MSGTLPPPFNSFAGGGTPLMPAQPAAPPAPQAPALQFDHRVPMHVVRNAHANTSQADMIRKRDSAGDIMSELAKVVNAPEGEINRADIVAYLGGMVGKGDVPPGEAAAILKTLPDDQDGMRQWARMMFSTVMNVGIHAHAAYPQELFPGGGQAQQAAAAQPVAAGAEEQAEQAEEQRA